MKRDEMEEAALIRTALVIYVPTDFLSLASSLSIN
jgi:hypothetical protein